MTDPATAEGPETGTPDSPLPAGGADPTMPEYKGAPLDAERGPGLGCFWTQVVLLVALLVLTPLSVVWAAPSWLSAALLILSLVILFFVGQTMIFLLRLVAADRRSRRRPLSSDARRTVGQLEDAVAPDSQPPLRLNPDERPPAQGPAFPLLIDTIIAVHGQDDPAWLRYWSAVYDGLSPRAFPEFWHRLRARVPSGTVREVVAAWSRDELVDAYDRLREEQLPPDLRTTHARGSDEDDPAPG